MLARRDGADDALRAIAAGLRGVVNELPDTASSTRPIERSKLDPQPATLGAYRLYERLGAGGQASVYRARRIEGPDPCDVALKRLHAHLADDDAAVRSFGREARIAYLLDHPVIRRVFSLCREAGELFMTMEYVAGVSLNDVLSRASVAQRRLPLRSILSLLHRLCSALHYAHELVDEHGTAVGFVHRDVSHSNLMLTRGGRLKLIDMGVARMQSADHITRPGAIKGKFGYMAPEVMSGSPFDRRADVFSVGVVAWELLTTRKLFPLGARPVDLEHVRARAIEAPSQHAPGCPAELDAVVIRALATSAADRWPTCAALADAVRDIAAGLGEPVTDDAIAELVDAHQRPHGSGAPVRPAPRSRLARGTPAELPESRPRPSSAGLAALEPGQDGGLTARCGRCRRRLALGAIGGSLATLVAVSVAAFGWVAPTRPEPDARATAATLTVPLDAGTRGPRREAVAGEEPDAAPGVEPEAAPSAEPDAAPGAEPDAAPEPDVSGPRGVNEADVTRIDGPWPRSRSAAHRYRARLCIDAEGMVGAAAVLEGPRRLEARITRALLRWRYQPYRAGGEARPVCFDVRARMHKVPRRA